MEKMTFQQANQISALAIDNIYQSKINFRTYADIYHQSLNDDLTVTYVKQRIIITDPQNIKNGKY